VPDDVGEVLIALAARPQPFREVARADQEERRAPGAPTIGAVALRAEGDVDALGARGARPRSRRVEDRCESRREDAEQRDGECEREHRAEATTHGAEDTA
jgi:hypothetical protein